MDRTEMLKRLRKGEDPLELSIEKWQDIVDVKGENLGAYNCALCELYLSRGCNGCVIYEKTKCSGCLGTPYEKCIHYSSLKDVLEELEFLKSLRKKEA